MNLPREIQYVGKATLYVLGSSDYKLILGNPASSSSSIIIDKPVPPEVYEGHVMTIADALLMLIGNDNRLLIDQDHKLISFERIPRKGDFNFDIYKQQS